MITRIIFIGPNYDILCNSKLMTYVFETNDIICV